MVTVTLKNMGQSDAAILAIEANARVFEGEPDKSLKNESAIKVNGVKNNKIHSIPYPSYEYKAVKEETSTISYWLLVIVIMLHIAAVSSLLMKKDKKADLIEQTKPMTVSLVSEELSSHQPKIKQLPVADRIKIEASTKQPVPALTKSVQVIKTTTTADTDIAQPSVTEAVAAESATQANAAEENVVSKLQDEVSDEQVIEQPKFGVAYLNNPEPVYPTMARRQGEQGRVLLKVLVSEKGVAEQVQVTSSSGYEKLDEAAIEAVKKWRFIPAKRSNHPVSAYVLVPIKFSLKSS